MRRAEQLYFEDTVIDIIIRGFVKDLDSVTVELNESSGMVRVKGLVMWTVFWPLWRMAMKDEMETQTIEYN